MNIVKRVKGPRLYAKVYWDEEWSEYRVRFYMDGHYLKDADYHTDDLSDAVSTAESVTRG